MNHSHRLPALLLTLLLLVSMPVAAYTGTPDAQDDAPPAINAPYLQSEELTALLGLEKNVELILYTPEDPQPRTVFTVVSVGCEIAIDNQGIFSVREKGIVSPLSGYLDKWKRQITEASGGQLTFTNDPNKADLMLAVSVHYYKAGDYSMGKVGYSCDVSMNMYQLTGDKRCYMSRSNKPGNKVQIPLTTLREFWMAPPSLTSVKGLETFTAEILSWYEPKKNL